MIRMIIADDEPVIIRGIKKLLNWEKLGIEITAAYSDGAQALDGILLEKPDIALLDIAMPEKTGIEILKELREFACGTKVVFVSGYQNFTYAQEAVKYGAVDYILKPILEEELEKALQKCMQLIKRERQEVPLQTEEEEEGPKELYSWLGEGNFSLEAASYLSATVRIFYEPSESQAERELIHFSIYSYLEQRLGEEGILFERKGQIVIVLKEADKEQGKAFLYRLKEETEAARHHGLGIVVGNVVSSMSRIPEQYQLCREKEDYFYFREYLPGLLLDVEDAVFWHDVGQSQVQEGCEAIYRALMQQSEDLPEKELEHYFRLVCILSDGRREDACFHLCNGIRDMEERFREAGLSGLGIEVKDLLAEGRGMEDYRMLKEYFGNLFLRYRNQVKEQVRGTEKTALAYAKEYLEEHYQENISLEILAKEVHMNPYYFSAYFKKGTGKNYKDYLNEIRLAHALDLLVATDKLTYEIAEEVGYRDGRIFSERFQKYYGETPSSYRKRVRGGEKS